MHVPHPDRIVEAQRRMEEVIAEQIYGGGPDARVEELRRSILRDEYVPPRQFLGLMAALDAPDAYGSEK